MNINLDLVMEAVAFYGNWCHPATVPYLVDPDIMAFTCPPGVVDRRLTHFDGKQYVASAEQSFLQIEKEGKLGPTCPPLMALTPCYRDESVLDDVHLNIFLKLEIFDYNPPSKKDTPLWWAERMVEFFDGRGVWTHIVKTDIGYDVLTKSDLELGSFGYRTSPQGVRYVYATGLAEPRASIAIEEENG